MKLAAAVTALIVAGACSRADLADPVPLPALDEPYFRCRVQPAVARDCAFPACHGDERRFFRLYARNRLRLTGNAATLNDPLTSDERQANFEAARALVDTASPAESLLLAKPLDRRASGGRFHRGAEIFGGGDVYLTPADEGYQVLRAWIAGAQMDPGCVELGIDL